MLTLNCVELSKPALEWTQLALTRAVRTRAPRGAAQIPLVEPTCTPHPSGNRSQGAPCPWAWLSRVAPPLSPTRPPSRTHQLFLTLDHSKCRFVAVAILPARVPVSWFLREEVAFSSVQQPVLRAGRFALDAALGGCREKEGLSSRQHGEPLPGPQKSHFPCLW